MGRGLRTSSLLERDRLGCGSAGIWRPDTRGGGAARPTLSGEPWLRSVGQGFYNHLTS